MNNLPTPEEVERSLHLENFEYENRYTYLRDFAALLREINGQGTPIVDANEFSTYDGFDRNAATIRVVKADVARELERLLSLARTEERERCAKVCEDWEYGETCAAAIRALPSEGA